MDRKPRKSQRLSRKWTIELIIAEIKLRAEQGHSLACSYVLKEDSGLVMAARKYFGSWNNALIAAFDPDTIMLCNPKNKISSAGQKRCSIGR